MQAAKQGRSAAIYKRKPACYYHGTDAAYAGSILSRGFQLGRQHWGRGWGNGVYLSKLPAFASVWGQMIIVCELQTGTRILWHRPHDPKVIRYLQREFGVAVTTPEGWKLLPRNKQFTRNEIINLWNYLVEKHYSSQRRFRKRLFERLQENYSRLHEQLRLHGFAGVGISDPEWSEVLIFNPSNVTPVSAHRWSTRKRRMGASIPLRRLRRSL